MATANNFVEEGIDRFQSAVDSVQEEIQRLQKDFRKRTRKLEKEAEKRVKRFQTDLRKSEIVKRAESFRDDVRKQVEQSVDGVLASFQIASKSDVKKIDRKLNAINRKIRDLEQSEKASA